MRTRFLEREMRYWLMKTEPAEFSLADLKRAPGQTAPWDGVRNYQARNYMRDGMRLGDRVLFYHSSTDPLAVVGTARIVREAYPDESARDPKSPYYDPRSTLENPVWLRVDIQFESELPCPVSLAELRKLAELKDMLLLRKGMRLSIQPVTREEFEAVVAHAGRLASSAGSRACGVTAPGAPPGVARGSPTAAGTLANSGREDTAPQRVPGAAGLILAGGQSRRMGRDKAGLRFGPETLLALAVRRMRRVARPVVVSLGPDQALPSGVGASGAIIVRDETAYGGPLPGLLLGFRALANAVPAPAAVLVMPVDLPFYRGAWMRRALKGLADRRACLYSYQGYVNALVGAYEMALLPKLERLAGLPKARPLALSEGEPTRVLELEGLWRPQDGPAPLMDTDTPEDYRMALALAGMGHPEGVPVAVTLPGTGTGMGEQLLLARSAHDVSLALARLYPEWPGATPALERIAPDGRARPIASDGVLRPGDRLRWRAAGAQAP